MLRREQQAGPLSFTLLEMYLQGKLDQDRCEDAITVGDHFVAVIDGMSSPLATRTNQPSGRRFAEGVATAVARLDPQVEAREAVDEITAAIAGITVEHAGPAGAVAAIYSAARREIWRVGDVHLRIGSLALPGSKAVDEALSLYRAAVNATHLAAGETVNNIITNDPGLTAAGALLRGQHHLANRDVPFGYGVFNGTSVPNRFVEIHPVPSGVDVVLATDGYLGPAETLAAAELELAAAVAADPACIGILQSMVKSVRPPQTVPDDRAYLRLHVHRAGQDDR